VVKAEKAVESAMGKVVASVDRAVEFSVGTVGNLVG
jgi:hypothetical protein